MVDLLQMGKHYTYKAGKITKEDNQKLLKAWAGQERIHFKPMFETAKAIKGMNAKKALVYLQQVIDHQRAVPFFRYNEGITHHSQGHEWGCPSARWPEKCCKLLIKLLKQALASTEHKKDVNADNVVIQHIQVNRAQYYRYRRIHQAHGRVKSYCSPPTNVQIILAEPTEAVPAAAE